jgi:SAM-dependent methyltransferase
MTPELGRGYIDYLAYQDGRLTIGGWMFSQDRCFDSFLLKVNAIPLAEIAAITREDVQKAFPFVPHALQSGFLFDTAVPGETFSDWASVEVLGVRQGQETARINIIYRPDFHSSLPTPPVRLMQRVANADNAMVYWCRALKSFGEFLEVMQEHCDVNAVPTLLDWGCGCGRVAGLFMKHTGIPRIYGCDIDGEAVEWCSRNLGEAHFSIINPYPPTRYADSLFHAIIGYSVFTHLRQEVQMQWLQEMERIMTHGGLFFASVHGDFAASFAPPAVQEEVRKRGISDSTLDKNLDGIAPEGYYRGVYQTKEYIFREWGRYFRIVDYRERLMGNFQDLVVMQKR